MSTKRITELEQNIGELIAELNALRKTNPGTPVPNYTFATLTSQVTLLELFGGKDKLLAIHNMGQGCRYCTLWADGFNGLLPHLESALSVVLLSKDPPEVQRRFANARGWRFRLASHGGGVYMREQSVVNEEYNYPGAVVYERDGDTNPAQERVRVRPRRHLLCDVEPARLGGTRRRGMDAAVQLLATPRRIGRRRLGRARLSTATIRCGA